MISKDTRRPPAGALTAFGLLVLAGVAPPVDAQEAPGELALDPEAAERALERTLVARGQLLLPVGQVEVEPGLTYEYSDRDAGFAFTGTSVTTVRRKRDELTLPLEVRVGLPGDSQFELRVPFVYESFDDQAGENLDVASDTTSGLGDIRVGFAKTLARESGALPDIVGRIVWDTATGKETESLSLTTGYHEILGSLSAVRRLDPLVLTGGVFYETSLERDDVDPGDVFGFNVGTTLAASPATALSFGFNAAFRDETEVQNETVNGSDQNQAFITLGVSTVVRRNTLLSVNVGAGLTEDSPDYFISASLPIRFSAW
jgi:hypothetical protein